MKYSNYGAALLWPLLCVLTPARAAAPVPPPAGPAPVVLAGGKGVLEFIERLRFEDRRENFDFNAAAHSPTDDSWFVQRFRVGLTWKQSAAFSLQVQLQDAREWGAERPTVPFILGAEGDDALDLRLASLTWGDPKKDPLVFTLGRQILALGEERLVGVGEWNNFSRTFDAGKLVWNVAPGSTTATFFLGSVVYVQGTTLGDGWKFNTSTTNDIFGGA
jgi:Alginate export